MRPQLPGILTRGAMLPQMESPNSAVVGATACMGGLVIPSDAWTLSGMSFCRRGVLILGRLAAADAGQLHFQLALLTTLAGALQCLFLISSRARHTSAELQLPFLAAAMALRMRLVQNSLPAPIFCACRHGWHIRARGTRKAIKAGVEGSRWQVPVRAGGRPRGCMRVPRSTARESCRPNIPPWGEALRSHGRQTSFQTCRGRACFGRRLAQSWRRQQPLQVRVCSNMRVVLVVAETAFRGGIKNLCPVGGGRSRLRGRGPEAPATLSPIGPICAHSFCELQPLPLTVAGRSQDGQQDGQDGGGGAPTFCGHGGWLQQRLGRR